jgi:hypothetical protein
MVRMLNIVCAILITFTVLGLYQISEKTRVTQMELGKTTRQIVQQRRAIAVLETEWQHVAAPDRVQHFAGLQGMNDAASVQLSAFDQLPHRGEEPLNGSPLRNASAEAPAAPATEHGF